MRSELYSEKVEKDKELSEDDVEWLVVNAKLLLDWNKSEEEYQKGIKMLKEAVNNGSDEAMCLLGKEYEYGFRMTRNLDKAIKLYEQAAELGNADAIYKLAQLYHSEINCEDHFTIAMDWLNRDEVAYYGDAQYLKGLMYWKGEGVDMDANKAIDCMERAAIFDEHIEANFFLGDLFEFGHRPIYDFDYYDPRYVIADPCRAARYYESAANKGHAESQYSLAKMKLEGRGTSQDYQGAFFLLWGASTSHNLHGRAMFALAEFYLSGLLFPDNINAALFWALSSQNFFHSEESNSFIMCNKDKIKKTEFLKIQKKVLQYRYNRKKACQGKNPYLLPPHLYLKKYGYEDNEPTNDTEYKSPEPKIIQPAKPEKPVVNDALSELSQWKVTDAKLLTITLNYSDKAPTAVFRYQDKKLSFPVNKVFSTTNQDILVKHNNSIKADGRAISYHGRDLCNTGKNKNHYYIEHFNSHLRKLLGADVSFKPFTWLGHRGVSDKGLKMHFILEIYRPQ